MSFQSMGGVAAQDVFMLVERSNETFIRSTERFVQAADGTASADESKKRVEQTVGNASGQWIMQLVHQMITVDRIGLAIWGKTLMPQATLGVEHAPTWWSTMRRQIEHIGGSIHLRPVSLRDHEADPHKLCIAFPMPISEIPWLILGIERKIGVISEDERLMLIAIARLVAPYVAQLAEKQATIEWETVIGQVCHELLNRLATTMMSIQMAERKLQQLHLTEADATIGHTLQDVYHFLHIADRQMRFEDRLVNDLSDLAHEQERGIKVRIQRCDLVAVIAHVIEAQRLMWTNRTITLEAPPEIILFSDPDRLSQVATNYLTNALKYAPPEYPVQVRLMQNRRSVRLEVSDHGPGLTREERQHIWDPYYRVKATSQRIPGWGLGLSIIRAIMHSLNGRAGVESSLGAGSTFWFRVPIVSKSGHTHDLLIEGHD